MWVCAAYLYPSLKIGLNSPAFAQQARLEAIKEGKAHRRDSDDVSIRAETRSILGSDGDGFETARVPIEGYGVAELIGGCPDVTLSRCLPMIRDRYRRRGGSNGSSKGVCTIDHTRRRTVDKCPIWRNDPVEPIKATDDPLRASLRPRRNQQATIGWPVLVCIYRDLDRDRNRLTIIKYDRRRRHDGGPSLRRQMR